MINIQPFISKLDKLREYMDYFVEWSGFFIWMDLQVCEDSYYLKRNLPIPNKPYKKYIDVMTFDEWYELNKN